MYYYHYNYLKISCISQNPPKKTKYHHFLRLKIVSFDLLSSCAVSLIFSLISPAHHFACRVIISLHFSRSISTFHRRPFSGRRIGSINIHLATVAESRQENVYNFPREAGHKFPFSKENSRARNNTISIHHLSDRIFRFATYAPSSN